MLRERYDEKFKPNESFKLATSTPEEPEDYDVSSADNANIEEQFIPDNDEDNYNFPPSLDVGIGVYNTAKLVTEGALTTLPAAERVFGFKREGTLREHQFFKGKYVDSYVLGLLRKDWENKNGN